MLAFRDRVGLQGRHTEFFSQTDQSKAIVQGTLTFRDAVLRLRAHHLHRLFVVDVASRPVGVFSLTDVLSVLADSIL